MAKMVFLNILTILSKAFILDVLLSSEFFSGFMNLLLQKSVILTQKSFISQSTCSEIITTERRRCDTKSDNV